MKTSHDCLFKLHQVVTISSNISKCNRFKMQAMRNYGMDVNQSSLILLLSISLTNNF